ncbi:MAG: hypothetical protein J7L80_04680 [Thermoplasmata archaeon]|nr:hypothetical protein [Thermoplasmata archaeon]
MKAMNSKDYFDKVAHRWDEMQKGFFSDAIRSKIFSILDVQPGKIAADVGAGTGFITKGLIEIV